MKDTCKICFHIVFYLTCFFEIGHTKVETQEVVVISGLRMF